MNEAETVLKLSCFTNARANVNIAHLPLNVATSATVNRWVKIVNKPSCYFTHRERTFSIQPFGVIILYILYNEEISALNNYTFSIVVRVSLR